MQDPFARYWHDPEAGPRLLVEYSDAESRRRSRIAAIGAIAWHLLLILAAGRLPAGAFHFRPGPEVAISPRQVTPLIVPRNVPEFRITQKEPNHGKPAEEVDIESLRARSAIRQPNQAPPGRAFAPPTPSSAPAPVLEAPKIETAQQGLPNVPNLSPLKLPGAPPPPEPAKSNPFEKVGPSTGVPNGRGPNSIAPPKNPDEVLRAAMRAGGRGPVVSDLGAGGSGGISEGIIQNQTRPPAASALEMISDPQGVDFRPYLIQVLSTVRRNWQAVYPESARLGRQGKVTVQFSIDRVGKIPKLVIAVPSGTEALDRAAVAGISASWPFPPLPSDFKGSEIRLQLVFSYNLPR